MITTVPLMLLIASTTLNVGIDPAQHPAAMVCNLGRADANDSTNKRLALFFPAKLSGKIEAGRIIVVDETGVIGKLKFAHIEAEKGDDASKRNFTLATFFKDKGSKDFSILVLDEKEVIKQIGNIGTPFAAGLGSSVSKLKFSGSCLYSEDPNVIARFVKFAAGFRL